MRHKGRTVQIKTPAQVELMRAAGLVVGRTLERLRTAALPGVSTADLDRVAEESIRSEGATPSFLGYRGFPGSVCASVNAAIVHGIPSPDVVLREGDIVSLDCGAVLDGFHGDAAVTVPIGEVSPERHELLRVTELALWQGLAAAQLGGRVTDISAAVEAAIRAEPHPGGGQWGIVEEYVGHGIGTEMHQEPVVFNLVRPGMARGPRLVEGMALAVEPMVNLGARHTRVLGDGWTVVTTDGQASAHCEHTVAICADGPWVLTALDGGRERIAALRSGQSGRGEPTTALASHAV